VAGAALAWVAHRVPYFPFDVAVTRHVQSIHAGWFVAPLAVLSVIGFPPVVDVVYGAIVLLILRAGWWWQALVATFSVLLATAVSHLVKSLVARPRPLSSLVHVAHAIPNPSFPAGHVLNFTAFTGFLSYLAWTKLAPSWRRSALVAALIALIGLMGVARIDAGEHWPSDVTGGYLFGALCWASGVGLYRWGEQKGWSQRINWAKSIRRRRSVTT
jgi:undecaprenyl-diphosphatase